MGGEIHSIPSASSEHFTHAKDKLSEKNSKLSNKISLIPKGLTAPMALALVYSQNLEKSVFHFPFRCSWNPTSTVHPGSRLCLHALGPGTSPDGRSAVREVVLVQFSSLWVEVSSRDLASSDPSPGNSTQT